MKGAEVKVWLILGMALALNLGLKDEAMACGDSFQEKNKDAKPTPASKVVPASGNHKVLKSPAPEKTRLPVLIGPASLLLTPWLSHFRLLSPVDTTA
jgi:hypothetical protein